MPAKSRRNLTLPPGENGARARTHRRLLASAMQLVRRGRTPSVAEVALTAGVSRATAYRYFPNRSTVIAAVVAESLGPVRRYEPRASDGRQRVRELFSQTFPRFKEFEPHMRAALQLSLEHESLERVGLLEEPRYRRGFRRDLLRRAAAPLRNTLGRRRFNQLLKALSLVYGIEAYVVLKDIWGAGDREVEEIARWMVDALINAALHDTANTAAIDGADGAAEHATRLPTPIHSPETGRSISALRRARLCPDSPVDCRAAYCVTARAIPRTSACRRERSCSGRRSPADRPPAPATDAAARDTGRPARAASCRP